ncbi:MAG: hypothetical protein NVSMB44_27750 [Ktedonobacteraceae bacterium]
MVVEAEEKAVRRGTEPPKLSFGRNGAINDPALLRLIQREKPLRPTHLLKLASFFSKFPANSFLAEHLTVIALATIVADPRLGKEVRTFFNVDPNEGRDLAEDWFITYDQNNEDTNSSGLFFINLPNSDDAGLLIESQVNEEKEEAFFVIGVSPRPSHLPNEVPAKLKARKQQKRLT